MTSTRNQWSKESYRMAEISPEEQNLHKDLTERIIGCFFDVYNNLGFGFLERVYEKALSIELKKAGLSYESHQDVSVYYDGLQIGYYVTDLTVENLVLLELKAVEQLAEEHEYQLINYLRATSFEVGLLLNFGKTPQVKRRSFLNRRKSLPSSFSL